MINKSSSNNLNSTITIAEVNRLLNHKEKRNNTPLSKSQMVRKSKSSSTRIMRRNLSRPHNRMPKKSEISVGHITLKSFDESDAKIQMTPNNSAIIVGENSTKFIKKRLEFKGSDANLTQIEHDCSKKVTTCIDLVIIYIFIEYQQK